MKKKYSVPQKDKKDWVSFTKKMDNIFVKEEMSKIKLEFPNYSNKEILGLAAKKWQEQKNLKPKT